MQVVFLSMLSRITDDEMGRITQRGSQHAADAWTRIATHASKPEEQLQARQQVSVVPAGCVCTDWLINIRCKQSLLVTGICICSM